jgi:DNA-nicking Smr family endonuclease
MSSKKKLKPRGGPFEALHALKEKLEASAKAKPGMKGASPKAAPSKAAESPKMPPAAGRSEPEDEALSFHRLFAGVKPMDRSRAGRLPKEALGASASAAASARARSEAERIEVDEVQQRLRTLVDDGSRFEVLDDGERVEGRRIDVPPATVRRLRRGLLPIDARIDLHRMTVPEARGHLESFLRTMRTRGERCVLVIHGKGRHSPGGVAVLRGEVAAWLSQGPSSHHVSAFVTAGTADGGEGATYVLLRK